jgi:UDP-N-acetylmuramate--alanine ligase
MKNREGKHCHFIGIGGVGMSALATILLEQGCVVSGSDVAPSSATERLKNQGAEIVIGHSAVNLKNPSVVIYSTAIREENVEVKQAKLIGLPLLHRSELLGQLMDGYLPLLVTGTHGKTTTASLLTHLLVSAGLNPAYAVGGRVCSLDANGGYGNGAYFVAEADESDGSFLRYSSFGAIITNINNDHLDYWKTFGAVVEGFKKFIDFVRSPECLLWCGDDENLRSLHPKGSSYGFGKKNDLHIENFRQAGWKNVFDIHFEGIHYRDIEIPLIGGHNVLNAAAVFGLGVKIQISEDKIRHAFSHFKGVDRRLEFRGEKKGILVFDDYGHHPTEIFATLRGVRQAAPSARLVVAFQPHRYTRTRDCLHEFGPALQRADQVILTDIYAAGETPIQGLTSQTLLAAIQKDSAVYVPRDELAGFLASYLHPEDVLITMGAGDITKVGPQVLKLLEP